MTSHLNVCSAIQWMKSKSGLCFWSVRTTPNGCERVRTGSWPSRSGPRCCWGDDEDGVKKSKTSSVQQVEYHEHVVRPLKNCGESERT